MGGVLSVRAAVAARLRVEVGCWVSFRGRADRMSIPIFLLVSAGGRFGDKGVKEPPQLPSGGEGEE
eukprot:1528810-Prymnesium_polylepis.1